MFTFWPIFSQTHLGPIFPRKITFRGKFRGISWKNDFSKLFSRGKFHFSPTFFWGKIFHGIFPKIFPGKNV
jgi:hypothetical protein